MKLFFVTGNPPTSNGDLHVGHLSGPYLGADVFSRYQRLRGNRAVYLSFGDDHQSFVVTTAIRRGMAPEELVAQATEVINATLRAANISVDLYLTALNNERYIAFVQAFFRDLYDRGVLKQKVAPILYCNECNRYLFESFVSGRCPYCGEGSSGNLCEACGRVNDPTELRNPVCSVCHCQPERREYTGLFFPFERYRAALAEYFASRTTWRPHQLALCREVASQPISDYPACYPTDWGIPVPVEGFAGQTINAWFEMFAGHRAVVRAWCEQHGEPGLAEQLERGEIPLVQFCGFDNTSCNAILHAALGIATEGRFAPPPHVITNEFYLLDGEKFSTSRNHAIWGGDILRRVQADTLRYYVSRTNPEYMQTSFSYRTYRDLVDRDLAGRWTDTINRFLGCAHAEPSGSPPFEQELDLHAKGLLEWGKLWLARYYDLDEFSLRRASTTLHEYVEGCADYLTRKVLPLQSQRSPEYAQRLASLAALMKGLACFSAPLMPAFAQELWTALDLPGQVEQQGWSQVDTPFPANAALGPARQWFHSPAETLSVTHG